MSRINGKRQVRISLFCILLLGLVARVQKADSAFVEKANYIEVHGPDIAYVPMTAKYVKYDGIVRKISKFSAIQNADEKDCQCPKCCDGSCYVIIYTGLIFPSGPIRVLYILWIEC